MGRGRQETMKKRYGAVALVGISVMASLYLRFEPGWQLAKFMVLGVLLLTIAIIDAKWFVIPNSLLLFGLLFYILGALWSGMTAIDLFFSILLGGCAIAVPLSCFVLLADNLFTERDNGRRRSQIIFCAGCVFGTCPYHTDLVFCLPCGNWDFVMPKSRAGPIVAFCPIYCVGCVVCCVVGRAVAAMVRRYYINCYFSCGCKIRRFFACFSSETLLS